MGAPRAALEAPHQRARPGREAIHVVELARSRSLAETPHAALAVEREDRRHHVPEVPDEEYLPRPRVELRREGGRAQRVLLREVTGMAALLGGRLAVERVDARPAELGQRPHGVPAQ